MFPAPCLMLSVKLTCSVQEHTFPVQVQVQVQLLNIPLSAPPRRSGREVPCAQARFACWLLLRGPPGEKWGPVPESGCSGPWLLHSRNSPAVPFRALHTPSSGLSIPSPTALGLDSSANPHSHDWRLGVRAFAFSDWCASGTSTWGALIRRSFP